MTDQTDETKTATTLADFIAEDAVDDNPFAMFETNQNAETAGVRLDYGVYYIKIARAGGANKAFTRHVSEATKPYKRLIQEDRLPENVAQNIAIDAMVETVVLGWGSKKHGDNLMVGKTGEPIAYNQANVRKLFVDLPELFQDVYEQARKTSVFRFNEQEEDSGN